MRGRRRRVAGERVPVGLGVRRVCWPRRPRLLARGSKDVQDCVFDADGVASSSVVHTTRITRDQIKEIRDARVGGGEGGYFWAVRLDLQRSRRDWLGRRRFTMVVRSTAGADVADLIPELRTPCREERGQESSDRQDLSMAAPERHIGAHESLLRRWSSEGSLRVPGISVVPHAASGLLQVGTQGSAGPGEQGDGRCARSSCC